MKYLYLICFCMALSPITFATPDFTFTHNGDAVQLSDFKGQVVYLDFWASWCIPCRTSFPWMIEMQNEYGARGLQVIAVNLDTDNKAVDAFLTHFPVNFPVVRDPDGNIATDFELLGMPSSYIIDKAGTIRFSHQGFFVGMRDKYQYELELLLNEE